MVIDIREVRPHDKAEWLQLWEGYTRFYGSPQPEEVTECTWQRMLEVNSPVLGRVAVVDDTVVGFAICILHEGTWVTTPICYLEDLFVDPAFRGQGIARTLIKSLQTEGAEKGWSRLYWHTRRDNPARHLYDEFTPADDYVRYRITLDSRSDKMLLSFSRYNRGNRLRRSNDGKTSRNSGQSDNVSFAIGDGLGSVTGASSRLVATK
ncbi:N-acetyltransferase GCN5 [Klebsiella quasipneumoniae]|nr:N-acetyltransferase GCN5 [Klebsiella quasipneumoniae]